MPPSSCASLVLLVVVLVTTEARADGGYEEGYAPPPKTKFNIGFNLPAMSITLPKLELPQISIKASVKNKKPFTLKMPIIKFNAHASSEEDNEYGGGGGGYAPPPAAGGYPAGEADAGGYPSGPAAYASSPNGVTGYASSVQEAPAYLPSKQQGGNRYATPGAQELPAYASSPNRYVNPSRQQPAYQPASSRPVNAVHEEVQPQYASPAMDGATRYANAVPLKQMYAPGPNGAGHYASVSPENYVSAQEMTVPYGSREAGAAHGTRYVNALPEAPATYASSSGLSRYSRLAPEMPAYADARPAARSQLDVQEDLHRFPYLIASTRQRLSL